MAYFFQVIQLASHLFNQSLDFKVVHDAKYKDDSNVQYLFHLIVRPKDDCLHGHIRMQLLATGETPGL